MIALLASASPFISLHRSVKFVAGAYVVFLAIVLVYVAIMAIRAQRIERDLDQLQRDVEAARRGRETDAGDEAGPTPERSGSLL